MTRYHPEDKEKTRRKILAVAARRYRAEGLNEVGIANLMADLGLTHGGFYAHFADKEALVAAVCNSAFSAQIDRWHKLLHNHSDRPAREVIVRDYLSDAHLHHPETGCLAAAVAGEMARRDTPSRQAFTNGIKALLGQLRQEDPGIAPEVTLALMLGAVTLARAVSDQALSERFLTSAYQVLLDPEAPPR
jgi:TetR/AcrR family transcriptional repressor of nem operon